MCLVCKNYLGIHEDTTMQTQIEAGKVPAPILLAAMLILGGITSAYAENPPDNASTSTVVKSLAISPPNSPQPANLGKIKVKAMKEMVQALQQVKVALHTPFTDNPKLVDQIVCQLRTSGRLAPILDCGTQGWYSRRRDETQLTLVCQCETNLPERGHPWHATRDLDHVQIMYLRQLLKELPAPGRGNVVLLDDKGKVMATIKLGVKPDASGTD
jgi:hypothetical protein